MGEHTGLMLGDWGLLTKYLGNFGGCNPNNDSKPESFNF